MISCEDNVPVGTGEIYESDRPATAPLVSSLEPSAAR